MVKRWSFVVICVVIYMDGRKGRVFESVLEEREFF